MRHKVQRFLPLDEDQIADASSSIKFQVDFLYGVRCTNIFKLQVLPAEIVIHGEQLMISEPVIDVSVGVLGNPVSLHMGLHPRGAHEYIG